MAVVKAGRIIIQKPEITIWDHLAASCRVLLNDLIFHVGHGVKSITTVDVIDNGIQCLCGKTLKISGQALHWYSPSCRTHLSPQCLKFQWISDTM